MLKKSPNPRMIARKLGVSRKLIYSLRRELRRKAKTKQAPNPQRNITEKFNKPTALDLIKSFAADKIHRFYTSADVYNRLKQSNEFEQTPSLSTIRRWMKTDLRLSYKKVNIRFKE